MADNHAGEIIRADGSVVPVERRSPLRGLPTYARSAGSREGQEREDRRRRRRIPDEMLRGRIVDTLG